MSREFVLDGRVGLGHGVCEAAVGKGDDFVPGAFVEGGGEDLPHGGGVADGDFVGGYADEVACGRVSW